MPAAPKVKGLVRATTSFAGPDQLLVQLGSIWNADDPVVKGRPALFEPVTPTSST